MSYVDDLNQAATDALAASSQATASSQIMFDVANGNETSTVTTAGGEVKTVSKAISDIVAAIDNGVSPPKESVTLTAGQTTVNFTTVYAIGVAIYIDGLREFGFTEIDEDTIELDSAAAGGEVLWAVQRDTASLAQDYSDRVVALIESIHQDVEDSTMRLDFTTQSYLIKDGN